MKIVAKTADGFLITATDSEVTGILTSFGIDSPKPAIGQTIPAGDFCERIESLKKFQSSYEFRHLKESAEKLTRHVTLIEEQVTEIKKL